MVGGGRAGGRAGGQRGQAAARYRGASCGRSHFILLHFLLGLGASCAEIGRHVMSHHAGVEQGRAGPGRAGLGWARHGMAWQGWARLGTAGHGTARARAQHTHCAAPHRNTSKAGEQLG